MPAPYLPLAIANYFLQQHPPIEHMKLQKIVYCAHGWWLVTQRTAPPLVSERPQVWKFGPVFPSLYQSLKIFGSAPIEAPKSRAPLLDPDSIDVTDETAHRLLEWVWSRYGHLSSFALSEMTHKPGTAWYIAASESDFNVPQGYDIPDRFVFQEFWSIYESETSEPAAG